MGSYSALVFTRGGGGSTLRRCLESVDGHQNGLTTLNLRVSRVELFFRLGVMPLSGLVSFSWHFFIQYAWSGPNALREAPSAVNFSFSIYESVALGSLSDAERVPRFIWLWGPFANLPPVAEGGKVPRVPSQRLGVCTIFSGRGFFVSRNLAAPPFSPRIASPLGRLVLEARLD